jgi:hypothetical protein
MTSVASAASESNVLVVAPTKALGVALAVLLMEICVAVVAPWLLLQLRTTPAQRAESAKLARSIAALRTASNKLNSPATFAEYSKVQRTLNHELKRQTQLQMEMGGGAAAAPLHAMQQFALSYGLKALVYASCFFACVGSTIFVVPIHGWMAPLAYTPLRVSGTLGTL